MKRAADERFAEKCYPLVSGCIVWTAARTWNGYGMFHLGVGRKTVLVHRYAWERVHGPVPTGLVIDHLCRVRDCVNVTHMEVVTHRENVLRGVSVEAARARAAKITHCPQGHEYTGENTLISRAGTRRCRKCKNEGLRRYYRAKSLAAREAVTA